MPRSLLPTRGVFVPASLIYHCDLPPAVFHTWVQLRGLAWGLSETPQLSLQQLVAITGKSQSCIYGHLTSLRDWGALRWRPSEGGTIIVSFDAEPTIASPDSRSLEKHDPSLTADQFQKNEDLGREGGSGNSRNLESPNQGGSAGAGKVRGARREQVPALEAATPAARLYQELTGLPTTKLQEELMADQVYDRELWRATLEHWLAHGWSPRNIIGQLDLYQRGGPGSCLHCNKQRTPLDHTLETLEQMRKELTFGDPG